MMCITDAYGVMNVKQARNSEKIVLFVALLHYFFHPHLNRIRQAFEAAGKVVQTGKYSESVSC